MKLVKKLLRLLPLFSFISLFLFLVFQKIYVYNDPQSMQELDTFYKFWETLFTKYNNLIGSIDIFGNIDSWFATKIFIGNNENFLYFAALYTLEYEIVLSIMFLIFDVFNFILGIANKFINKGEEI